MNLLYALWLIFPAYVANGSAVIFGGGTPIDFGKKWRGKPILGKGKTWRGLAGGIIAGVLAGSLMNLIHPSFGDWHHAISILFALSFGALFGDMVESFLKRRFGRESGEPWLIADQIDFLLGAFLFSFLFSPSWFAENFNLPRIIFLLLFTPLIHLATNLFAYMLKIKKVPW